MGVSNPSRRQRLLERRIQKDIGGRRDEEAEGSVQGRLCAWNEMVKAVRGEERRGGREERSRGEER